MKKVLDKLDFFAYNKDGGKGERRHRLVITNFFLIHKAGKIVSHN